MVPHSISPAVVAKLAADSHGFTGADLSLLVKEATLLAVRRLLRLKDSAGKNKTNSKNKRTTSGLVAQVDALVKFYSQDAVGGSKTVEQCRSILLKRIHLSSHGTNAENTGLSQSEWSVLCSKLQTKYPSATPVPTAFDKGGRANTGDGDSEVEHAAMQDSTSLVVLEEDALRALGIVRPSSMREMTLEIPSGETEKHNANQN